MDEKFDSLYRSEEKMSVIFSYFSVLTILIASLGLFGLSAFMAEQRTKEIGVRKVLGASLKSIFILISKEFTQLVLIANIFAMPVAYYAMSGWLNNFSYRTAIRFEIFIISALLSLIIALITVSYHSMRASLINPVQSLKHE